MGALSPPRRPSLTRLKIKALCRCTRVKPSHARGARCRVPTPSAVHRVAFSVLLRRLRDRVPRLSISRSASQALWVSDGGGWRPAVTTYSSTHAMGLARPPSRMAGVAAEQRTGCRASLMAR